MMRDNYIKLKKALEDYILNNEYQITENLLEYINERIKANENELKKLIEIKKENVTYEEIEKIIREESTKESAYKKYAELKINEEKFISTCIAMPIGIIAVEAYSTKEVIKWYIRAIKSRNAIAISDVEYAEDNVKSLVLVIIKEALKKYKINENLIMLLPYEECFYEYFDEVIYTYDDIGNTLETLKADKKEKTNEIYVYIENNFFEEEAQKNKNAKVLRGNIEEAINLINKSKAKGAVIYTKETEQAYKFINLVHSENVFVNTNLENIQEVKRKEDLLCEYKNIIIPIPQESKEIEKQDDDIESVIEEKSLTVKENSILSKIKEFLKRLFK